MTTITQKVPPPLMSHEDRQALIRRPYPITYIHSVKRWAGVQLGVYAEWYDHLTGQERYHLSQRESDDAYASKGGQ